MIQFRPHHFMCTLSFQGRGYSRPFIHNYKAIVEQLNKRPDTLIKVVQDIDSICQACPHQMKSVTCNKQWFISELDKRHQQILDIKNEDVISWEQAKERIKTRMTIEKFQAACEGCEWKTYGICEKSLKALLDTS